MKTLQPGNHIDQLVRQTRVYHVQLSMMVDTKANMLLTMSSIVTTLAITKLTDPEYRYAALILIIGCLLTITLSCITVMPNLTKGKQKTGLKNILFFNDFAELDFEDYQNQMHQTLSDPTLCYEAQLKEIYLVGKYLYHRKYPLLRAAYIVFFLGFALAFLKILLK